MYQSDAIRAVVIRKPELGRRVDDHDVPMATERLERLPEPHPVLVLDVVCVEVGVVLVRHGCLSCASKRCETVFRPRFRG